MKGQGIFRGLMKAVAGIGKPKTTNYPDPVFEDRASHHHEQTVKKVKPKMKCIPGTIVYHDWLVRELGYNRRLADGYQYAFLNKYKINCAN